MAGPSPDVQQRLVAMLTAYLAGDTLTERSLAKEIFEDQGLLAESFAALENLAYELIVVLAKERNTSPENVLREIALAVANLDDDGPHQEEEG